MIAMGRQCDEVGYGGWHGSEKQVSVEKRVVRYRREKAEDGEDSLNI